MLANLTILIVHNVTFFSFIFWIITFALKYFYSEKHSKYKFNFYECGFKSLTNIHINYDLNFILIILFVLIYDGEFLLLFPCALNISSVNNISVIIITFFMLWLIITVVIDFMLNALQWQR